MDNSVIPKAPPIWQIQFVETQSSQTETQSSSSVVLENVIVPESSLTPVTLSFSDEVNMQEINQNVNVNNHHKGPINIQFIEDKQKRKNTFHKRKNTLLKNAKDIHGLTQCKINLSIEYNGRLYSYSSHQLVETCAQTDVSHVTNDVEPNTLDTSASSDAFQTPKKLVKTHFVVEGEGETLSKKRKESVSTKQEPKKVALKRPAPKKPAPKKPLIVEKMPRTQKKKEEPPKERVSGKCGVCGIIYESKEDSKFRKSRKTQTTWVGCDFRACKYWAHAICVGITLDPKDDVNSIPFKCFKHRKR